MEAPRRTHVDLIVHCLEKFKSERCIVFTNMKRNSILTLTNTKFLSFTFESNYILINTFFKYHNFIYKNI